MIMQKGNMVKMQNFVIWIQTAWLLHMDIAKDIQARFETSNFELEIPFPEGKKKKSIGLMKDELGGKIVKQFF